MKDFKLYHADYIYHKIEKGKPCEMDLPLLKNDITTTKAASQNEIHSRYL
jgi:hypothetical protein